jgi:hypothetical protein
MANVYKNFSQEDYLILVEKYNELLSIREAAVSLVGKEDTQAVLRGLQEREQKERKYKCPAHFCLGMTPSKKKVVEETWNDLIQGLTKVVTRNESIDFLVSQMGEKDSIEQAREYLQERKNFPITANEQKTFKRTFQ